MAPPALTPMRPLIQPVIEQATLVAERVRRELPTHDALHNAARLVVEAARRAERVTASMKRPWSPHRLPVMFLATAIVALFAVAYRQYIHVSRLTVALPNRDAADIRAHVRSDARLDVQLVEVKGSREIAALLEKGEVDLGYVQGGVPIPPALLRLEAPARELVLYFVRDPAVAGPPRPGPRVVLTSVEGEGSHTVAKAFFAAWSAPVTFVHAWTAVTSTAGYAIPADVDAALVVKDPSDPQTLIGAERLQRAGFRLAPPSLGARANRLDYLEPAVIPRDHLGDGLPADDLATYSVTTYLVARAGLTPRLLTQAARLTRTPSNTIADRSFDLSSGQASELLQGTEALFSILVHIGLGFLALLGLDVIAYRKQFHELNSLVSLISILQSNKDVLGVALETRRENLLYLSLCSDLLSLISTVSGHYTQENSSLLFNNLSEVVHARCDSLKINIQLKLLHAMVPQ